MTYKKTSDEDKKHHWSKKLLFLSFAFIAIGSELEKQYPDEDQSWD